MSNEQYREKENRGPLDTVGTVMGAALAVGAGAALVYKDGFNKYLSDSTLRRAGKALNRFMNETSEMTSKDFDLDTIKGFTKKYITDDNSIWERSINEFEVSLENGVKKNAVFLRGEGNNNIFEILAERRKILANPKAFLNKLYDTENIKDPLYAKYRDLAANENEAGKIQGFINDAVDNVGKYVDQKDYAGNNVYRQDMFDRHFKGTSVSLEKQAEIMNDIIQKLQEEKPAQIDDFLDANKNLPNDIADTMIQEISSKFSKKDKFFDDVISRAATAQDILNEDRRVFKNVEEVAKNHEGSPESLKIENKLDLLRELVNDHPEMADLVVDETHLRVNNNGELYSIGALRDVQKKFADEFANTIPGKLLKTREFIGTKDAPSFMLETGRVFDPILANMENQNSTAISSSYVRILDKTFKINPNQTAGGTLTHMEALDDTYLTMGEHGAISRMLKMMTGDADKGKTPTNKILSGLDMFGAPSPTSWQSAGSAINKISDPRWIRNIFSDFISNDKNYTDTAYRYKEDIEHIAEEVHDNMFKKRMADRERTISDYYTNIRRVNEWMSRVTDPLDKKAVNKLISVGSSPSQAILEFLKLDDEDMLKEFATFYGKKTGKLPGEKGINSIEKDFFKNGDLESLMNRYFNNRSKTVNSFTITSDKNIFGADAKKLDFTKMFRKELAKEAFMQEAKRGGPDAAFELINKAGLDGDSLLKAKRLGVWASIQHTTNTFMTSNNLANTKTAEARANGIIELQRLMSPRGVTKGEERFSPFREAFEKMVEDKSSLLETGFMEDDKEIINGNRYNSWIHMRKAKSIISVLNGDITAKAWANQFTAGRKNIGNITTATFAPYFSLLRLSDPLNPFGLGFSSRSTADTMDLAKNIMLKRVAPAIGAYTALTYLNDTAKQITGTSLTGAMANSVASMDLGYRRLTDATGITNILKSGRELNVMSQYLHNDEDYQSYDERLDWYRNGYSPVRKGRWWFFGSAQEWRGSKIDYYQPNFLARSNSDWYDTSVYGSSSEKWAHSWIPTPTHPLSTLRRLADPYWLERKHYWDRPYPMSGKLFSEGAPWSGVLNATVGEVLKPQRRMHQRELGSSMLDVRDLIARRNQEILNKSENNNLVRVDESGAVQPITFVPYGQTTPGRAVMSMHIDPNGSRTSMYGSSPSSGLEYNADSFNDYLESSYGSGSGAATGGSSAFSSGDGIPELSLKAKIKTTPVLGAVYENIANAIGVKEQIGVMNAGTMARAKQPKGMLVPDTIYKESARYSRDVLSNKEAMADIRNLGNSKDYLSDSLYSAKELLGMYGFAMETLMPGKRKYRLAQADTMTSFSRKFWGNNLGGWGGEIMEIARRFFPHEDHSWEDINPIRNTMPEWMPERFLHGDPYAAIPKGEMRLPGAGYEKMYRLHSDQFGKYGAYDRMKILADIAPYSQEYKIWRDIATKTVTDPSLKKNILGIRKRVNAQSKTHTFYDYQFINNSTERHDATISEVLNNNTFKIAGNDQIFKLAGISVGKETDMSRYLQPGMSISLGIDKNKYKRLNSDGTFNAVVYSKGENINNELLKRNEATKREDSTGAGVLAKTGTSSHTTASILELIAHADIPFVHDKFMRVETPLESYTRHHVYGTEFSTWNHPIKSMLMPELNRAWSQGLAFQALSYTAWRIAKNTAESATAGKLTKIGATVLNAATNRGAFVGQTLTKALRPNSSLYSNIGGTVGTLVGFGGYAVTRLNNPIASTFNFGLIGAKLGSQLIHDAGKGAKLGAVIGLGLSAAATSGFNKTKIFQPWIPRKTRKQWEIEENYDRLKYIKYMGLYKKAARKALIFEHQNIDRLLNKMDNENTKRQKIKRELLARKEKLSNTLAGGSSDSIREIDKALSNTYIPERVLKAGKWTRAALAYRQAAKSTMYGLESNATWAQVLRALPRQDRDYVLEFAKENDPKKRKKIEKYFSPYERRVLQTLWGEKVDKVKSNSKFFSTHQLPGPFWAGWKPDVDLDNVQIKTIKNEGLMLSDFGFYESELESPETKMAPTIDIHQQQSSTEIQKNLLAALNGSGLTGVNISVEPSSASGIQLIANIARTTQYNLQQRVTNTFGRIF